MVTAVAAVTAATTNRREKSMVNNDSGSVVDDGSSREKEVDTALLGRLAEVLHSFTMYMPSPFRYLNSL